MLVQALRVAVENLLRAVRSLGVEGLLLEDPVGDTGQDSEAVGLPLEIGEIGIAVGVEQPQTGEMPGQAELGGGGGEERGARAIAGPAPPPWRTPG